MSTAEAAMTAGSDRDRDQEEEEDVPDKNAIGSYYGRRLNVERRCAIHIHG